MKRDAANRLDHWLGSAERKPLIIRGARQTGKTWLVRDLAERHQRKRVEVNFERNPEWASYFRENNPKNILRNLAAETGQPINAADTLLFLDEIQAAPDVLASLRWFREEMPGLPVICAGSLLDFALAEHSFSMPVGRVTYLYLEPMSFLEFVRATGNQPLHQLLRSVTLTDPPDESIHKKCLELYRLYCLTGGMPESVKAWVASGEVNACFAVQADLLATLRDDFNKYGHNSELLRKTFASVARQLGSKFVLGHVDPAVRAADSKKALTQLALARVISLVRHSAGHGIPLGAETNSKFNKALMVDTGLVSAQLGLARMKPEEIHTMVFSNKGPLAEQFAGQQLRSALATDGDPELFYWQRTDGRQGEIDYLLQAGGRVVPVEVKSGSEGAMKSLHQFMADRRLDFAVRLDMNNLSKMPVQVKTTTGQPVHYTLQTIPVYLAERTLELI